MLYQIYEAQRSLMEPFADFAQASAKMYSNTSSLFGQTPFAQRVSAGYDLLYRLGKDYEKPSFGLQTILADGVELAIQERVEVDKPFCELRRFKRFTDNANTLSQLKGQPAVLIVAPLSGHYATLLRDTVKTMLKDHKVYITDWKNARLVPLSEGEFHLDDYVNYVQEFIRHLQGIYGNCHVISVCQPTVPVLAAVSLMASRGETTPLSMTMMGGPIDARRSPTAVNNLAMNKSFEWFENNVIFRVPANFPGAGRRVYPGFLQHTGFVAMNPDRHLKSHYDYFKDLLKGDDASTEAHRKFYDEYNAVLDMPRTTTWKPSRPCSRTSNWSTAPGTCATPKANRNVCARRTSRPPRCSPWKVNSTTFLAPARPKKHTSLCSGIAQASSSHLEAKGRRPLRHFQWPPLARHGLSAGQGLHPAAQPGGQGPSGPRDPSGGTGGRRSRTGCSGQARRAQESGGGCASRPSGQQTQPRRQQALTRCRVSGNVLKSGTCRQAPSQPGWLAVLPSGPHRCETGRAIAPYCLNKNNRRPTGHEVFRHPAGHCDRLAQRVRRRR